MARSYWNQCEREGVDVLEHGRAGGDKCGSGSRGFDAVVDFSRYKDLTRCASGVGALEGRLCVLSLGVMYLQYHSD